MRNDRGRTLGAAVVFILVGACGGGGGSEGSGSADGTASVTDTDGTGTAMTAGTSDPTAASTQGGPDTSASTGTVGTDPSDSDSVDTTVGESGATDDSSGGDDGTTGVGGEANVLYVRDDGQNGDPGTVDAPMRTIQWAIDQAVLLGGIDTIRVAEGEYGFDYANGAHIVMVDGVSLYGGYRADWGDRDPAVYVTRIVDESPSSIGSSDDNPHRAVEIPAAVGDGTVLDGFHIGVSTGQFRAAVFVRGDAIIDGNHITPTSDAESVRVMGLRIIDGDPTVHANHIALDFEQAAGLVDAVFATGSAATYANNLIDLTGGGGNIIAFQLINGAGVIVANSVWLPDSVNVYMVQLHGSAAPTIDNNLFESEDLTAVCINSLGAAAVPAALRNNLLGCYYTLFGVDPLRTWTTIMEIEGGLPGATDNLKLPANIAGPDDGLALDGLSPCTVTQGGRDVTADAPQDVDGVDRTVPLSIGAREWDAGCQ